MSDSLMHIVKTSAQWEERSIKYLPIPRGCLCVELTASKKTKIKIGEGDKYYSLLPYVDGECDLSQYYTKEEINNLLNNLNRMAIMSTEEYPEKEDLPLVNNKLGDVRFVKSSSPSLKLDPDIYLWNGHKWIFVGYDLVDIDLSQFIKREEFEPIVEKVNEMYPKMHTHENKDILDNIEEPYTTAEKDKLESLENYDDTEIRGLIRQATHVHPNKSILDQIEKPFKTADKEKLDSLENYDDTDLRNRVTAVESTAHTHSNKAELDSIYSGFVDEHEVLVEFKTIAENEIDSLQDDVADLKTKIHTHSNKNILDSTTAPYTREDKQTLTDLANITVFDGASATYDGFRGYVPAPRAGEQTYFLRGDGIWAKVKSGSGDKYKAGDGIFILSGDVTSDTFPFKVYSKSGHLSKYIIYGNTGGVGESMGSGVYGVNISITDEHGNASNTSIILPEKISFGDYIDYERQVFVHMRTNVSSLVNTVDPNYRYRWAIRSNGNISPTDIGAYGSSPQVTTLVELEPGTTYELYHECSYPAFSNYMNLNVYDVDQNRTRTMNFYDSTGKVPTIIALGPNEKYIRLTWEHCDWYPNTLIKVKAVETPITLPQIPLFPNSINTINVTNTIKPAEIYVEVAEPSEDDPDDPMSDFTGIIYNEGVLDITQEDPNALNELTVHFRESDKVITIPEGNTYIAGDGVDIDDNNEISAKLGSGLQFDSNGAIEAIPYTLPTASTSTLGGVKVGDGLEIDEEGVLSASGSKTYVAGDGIVITDNASFELSEDTVTNTVYFFDTQVTSSVSGRTFTKYNTEPALGAIVYASSYTQPFFVGLTADSVKYGTDYNSRIWPNPDHPSFEYKGVTWYYSGFEYAMYGDGTDASGHMQKLPGSYSVSTEADLQNIAKAIIDAADIITNPTKTISAKIGEGLEVDNNNDINVKIGDGLYFDADGAIAASGDNDYTAGEGIDIIGTTRPIDINYIRLDINNSRDNGSGHIIQFKNIRVLDTNGNSLQFSHASSIYGDGSAVEYGQNTRDESPQAMIEGRNKTCCTNFSLTKAPLKITFTLTTEISIANITSFSILTGADYTTRDPVSWDIYASNDGVTWYKIQEAHSPDVTTARSTWITDIPFVIPPDAVEVLPGVKTITAKIGDGLSFDQNDAITVDEMAGASASTDGAGGAVPAPLIGDETKFLRGDGTWQTVSGGAQYQAGQGIEIEPVPELIDQHFNYTDYINTVQGVEHGSIVKNNNDSFTITSTADDAYTYPYNPGYGALYTMAVEPNTKYRLTMDLSDWTVDSYVNVFKNQTTAYYWRADMPGDPYLEFTTESNTREIAFRFGVTYSGHTQTFSNIKVYQVSESTTADSISAKLGSGLQFDANGAIEAIPYTLPAASASTLGGVKVGAGLSMNANDEIGVTSPYVTSVANQGSVPGVITVAKSDGTSTDVDVLDNMRLILNCNYDSSITRNVLGEPVNAPVAANKTLSSIMENDLTILEV